MELGLETQVSGQDSLLEKMIQIRRNQLTHVELFFLFYSFTEYNRLCQISHYLDSLVAI